MKKQSISNTIELVYSENENSKLNFIKFLVDYFIDNHISEVNIRNEKQTTNIKENR